MKVIYTTHKSKVYKTPVGVLAGGGGGMLTPYQIQSPPTTILPLRVNKRDAAS